MGMVRLGEAHLVSGNRERGIELIRKAWSEEAFERVRKRTRSSSAHGDILRDADHRARLDQRLALDDIAAARRQIARVDGSARRVAEARLRLKSGPDAVASIMASLPAELHANRGLLHDASRAYRRRDRDEDAYEILLKTPADSGRRESARRMVERAPYAGARRAEGPAAPARLRHRVPARASVGRRIRGCGIPLGLDRAALPEQARRGAQAFPDARQRRQPADQRRPRLLLVGPGRGSAPASERSDRPLPQGCPERRDLLWPARTRAHRGNSDAPAAGCLAGADARRGSRVRGR